MNNGYPGWPAGMVPGQMYQQNQTNGYPGMQGTYLPNAGQFAAQPGISGPGVPMQHGQMTMNQPPTQHPGLAQGNHSMNMGQMTYPGQHGNNMSGTGNTFLGSAASSTNPSDVQRRIAAQYMLQRNQMIGNGHNNYAQMSRTPQVQPPTSNHLQSLSQLTNPHGILRMPSYQQPQQPRHVAPRTMLQATSTPVAPSSTGSQPRPTNRGDLASGKKNQRQIQIKVHKEFSDHQKTLIDLFTKLKTTPDTRLIEQELEAKMKDMETLLMNTDLNSLTEYDKPAAHITVSKITVTFKDLSADRLYSSTNASVGFTCEKCGRGAGLFEAPKNVANHATKKHNATVIAIHPKFDQICDDDREEQPTAPSSMTHDKSLPVEERIRKTYNDCMSIASGDTSDESHRLKRIMFIDVLKSWITNDADTKQRAQPVLDELGINRHEVFASKTAEAPQSRGSSRVKKEGRGGPQAPHVINIDSDDGEDDDLQFVKASNVRVIVPRPMTSTTTSTPVRPGSSSQSPVVPQSAPTLPRTSNNQQQSAVMTATSPVTQVNISTASSAPVSIFSQLAANRNGPMSTSVLPFQPGYLQHQPSPPVAPVIQSFAQALARTPTPTPLISPPASISSHSLGVSGQTAWLSAQHTQSYLPPANTYIQPTSQQAIHPTQNVVLGTSYGASYPALVSALPTPRQNLPAPPPLVPAGKPMDQNQMSSRSNVLPANMLGNLQSQVMVSAPGIIPHSSATYNPTAPSAHFMQPAPLQVAQLQSPAQLPQPSPVHAPPAVAAQKPTDDIYDLIGEWARDFQNQQVSTTASDSTAVTSTVLHDSQVMAGNIDTVQTSAATVVPPNLPMSSELSAAVSRQSDQQQNHLPPSQTQAPVYPLPQSGSLQQTMPPDTTIPFIPNNQDQAQISNTQTQPHEQNVQVSQQAPSVQAIQQSDVKCEVAATSEPGTVKDHCVKTESTTSDLKRESLGDSDEEIRSVKRRRSPVFSDDEIELPPGFNKSSLKRVKIPLYDIGEILQGEESVKASTFQARWDRKYGIRHSRRFKIAQQIEYRKYQIINAAEQIHKMEQCEDDRMAEFMDIFQATQNEKLLNRVPELAPHIREIKELVTGNLEQGKRSKEMWMNLKRVAKKLVDHPDRLHNAIKRHQRDKRRAKRKKVAPNYAESDSDYSPDGTETDAASESDDNSEDDHQSRSSSQSRKRKTRQHASDSESDSSSVRRRKRNGIRILRNDDSEEEENNATWENDSLRVNLSNSGTMNQCNMCQQTFETETLFYLHVKNDHLTCRIDSCKRAFRSLARLEKHQRNKHHKDKSPEKNQSEERQTMERQLHTASPPVSSDKSSAPPPDEHNEEETSRTSTEAALVDTIVQTVDATNRAVPPETEAQVTVDASIPAESSDPQHLADEETGSVDTNAPPAESEPTETETEGQIEPELKESSSGCQSSSEATVNNVKVVVSQIHDVGVLNNITGMVENLHGLPPTNNSLSVNTQRFKENAANKLDVDSQAAEIIKIKADASDSRQKLRERTLQVPPRACLIQLVLVKHVVEGRESLILTWKCRDCAKKGRDTRLNDLTDAANHVINIHELPTLVLYPAVLLDPPESPHVSPNVISTLAPNFSSTESVSSDCAADMPSTDRDEENKVQDKDTNPEHEPMDVDSDDSNTLPDIRSPTPEISGEDTESAPTVSDTITGERTQTPVNLSDSPAKERDYTAENIVPGNAPTYPEEEIATDADLPRGVACPGIASSPGPEVITLSDDEDYGPLEEYMESDVGRQLCLLCLRSIENRKALVRHITEDHLRCRKCSMLFETVEQINAHMSTHPPDMYSLPVKMMRKKNVTADSRTINIKAEGAAAELQALIKDELKQTCEDTHKYKINHVSTGPDDDQLENKTRAQNIVALVLKCQGKPDRPFVDEEDSIGCQTVITRRSPRGSSTSDPLLEKFDVVFKCLKCDSGGPQGNPFIKLIDAALHASTYHKGKCLQIRGNIEYIGDPLEITLSDSEDDDVVVTEPNADRDVNSVHTDDIAKDQDSKPAEPQSDMLSNPNDAAKDEASEVASYEHDKPFVSDLSDPAVPNIVAVSGQAVDEMMNSSSPPPGIHVDKLPLNAMVGEDKRMYIMIHGTLRPVRLIDTEGKAGVTDHDTALSPRAVDGDDEVAKIPDIPLLDNVDNCAPAEDPSVCLQCRGRFTDKTTLIQHHKSIHRSVEIFRSQTWCTFCKIDLGSTDELVTHANGFHRLRVFSVNAPFLKKQPKLLYPPKTHLAYWFVDVETSRDGKPMCKICLNTVDSISAHVKAKHKNNCFTCQLCKNSKRLFANQHQLANHLVERHAGKCDICEKDKLVVDGAGRIDAEKSKRGLLVHKKGHYKAHLCDFCTLETNDLQKFTDHMNKHSGAKPFVCVRCKQGFYDRVNHAKHEKDGCKNKIPQKAKQNIKPPKKAKAKNYQCGQCSEAFHDCKDLIAHVQSKHEDNEGFPGSPNATLEGEDLGDEQSGEQNDKKSSGDTARTHRVLPDESVAENHESADDRQPEDKVLHEALVEQSEIVDAEDSSIRREPDVDITTAESALECQEDICQEPADVEDDKAVEEPSHTEGDVTGSPPPPDNDGQHEGEVVFGLNQAGTPPPREEEPMDTESDTDEIEEGLVSLGGGQVAQITEADRSPAHEM